MDKSYSSDTKPVVGHLAKSAGLLDACANNEVEHDYSDAWPIAPLGWWGCATDKDGLRKFLSDAARKVCTDSSVFWTANYVEEIDESGSGADWKNSAMPIPDREAELNRFVDDHKCWPYLDYYTHVHYEIHDDGDWRATSRPDDDGYNHLSKNDVLNRLKLRIEAGLIEDTGNSPELPDSSTVSEMETVELTPHDIEFWKDAPEGATHYDPKFFRWLKKSSNGCGLLIEWWEGKWQNHFDFSINYRIIQKPAQEQPVTEWADGLPPIGVECEIREKGDGEDWEVAIVTACGDKIFIAKSRENGNEWAAEIKYWEFRPFKTAEQKAADERMSKIECEIDMISAYLEQIDSKLSDYDIQMFAQYIVDERLKESE